MIASFHVLKIFPYNKILTFLVSLIYYYHTKAFVQTEGFKSLIDGNLYFPGRYCFQNFFHSKLQLAGLSKVLELSSGIPSVLNFFINSFLEFK